jgi:hypothetical protein
MSSAARAAADLFFSHRISSASPTRAMTPAIAQGMAMVSTLLLPSLLLELVDEGLAVPVDVGFDGKV